MAASLKPLFWCILLLAPIFTQITSQSPSPQHSLKIELEQLKSKIALLESSIEERVHELERKDERIKEIKEIFQEKSDSISSLQLELESNKGPLDSKEQVRAHARAAELEKQVEKLKKEIETQNKKRDELEARSNVAERKIQELHSKLENLQKVNDEQKLRIHKTTFALQVTEEELIKAKFETASRSEKSIGVHGVWLPHWLEVHLDFLQYYIVTQWKEHGKPAVDVTIQKAREKKAQVGRWAEPHIEAIKAKWIPSVKEQWLTFISCLEPHVQTIRTKTIEAYHLSKSSVVPQVIKVQTTTDPYIQDAKKFMEPYIEQVVTVARPHFDKVHLPLKPYIRKAVSAYNGFIKSATVYHLQVQEILKNNELTRPLATMDLAWFAATALLTLPIIFLQKLVSAIFSKKERRRARSSRTHQPHRRPKRPHPDK